MTAWVVLSGAGAFRLGRGLRVPLVGLGHARLCVILVVLVVAVVLAVRNQRRNR